MAESSTKQPPISEAIEVSKSFSARSGLRAGRGDKKFVQAVDRVSIKINPGETMGLVGESGCGKSTLGRLLIRLETPTAGDILFNGDNITKLKGRRLRKQRQQMQMIFQDPASSLNPRFTVQATIQEAITAHRGRLPSKQLNAHTAALLDMVGLSTSSLHRLPNEFSGGERQRISIARALAVEPKFLVADEPVTSLDVSSQAQITRLLLTLQQELRVAFLLIAHDMETVRRMCAKVAVMYLGRIVEVGDTDHLFNSPKHPYSKALIASQLPTDPDTKYTLKVLPGDPPSPLEPPSGCHFHPRCPYADVQCELIVPHSRPIEGNRVIRCHFNFEGDRKVSAPTDDVPSRTSVIPPMNTKEK